MNLDRMHEIYTTIEEAARKYYLNFDLYAIGENTISFFIEWGDWKHDHLALKWLIEELYPEAEEVSSWVTAEDGSDCYSGVHKFCWRA